ncbi:MAG: Uma2 family endonuclease [Myxococcota bacterium]
MEAKAKSLSYREYLALERTEHRKYEWRQGQVVAMAGGTIEHGQIAVLLAAAFVEHLRGSSCRVLNSDVKTRIEAADRTTYPDLSIVCGGIERSGFDENAVTNPSLIVEVLSDSTEAADRGEKFAAYRKLPSLREYLLVSQQRKRLELFRRRDDGIWELRIAEEGDQVTLETRNVPLAVDQVYEGVTFSEPPSTHEA